MYVSKYQDKLSNIHFVAQEKVGMSVILQMGQRGHILELGLELGFLCSKSYFHSLWDAVNKGWN